MVAIWPTTDVTPGRGSLGIFFDRSLRSRYPLIFRSVPLQALPEHHPPSIVHRAFTNDLTVSRDFDGCQVTNRQSPERPGGLFAKYFGVRQFVRFFPNSTHRPSFASSSPPALWHFCLHSFGMALGCTRRLNLYRCSAALACLISPSPN